MRSKICIYSLSTNAVNNFINAIINDTKPEVDPLEARKIQQLAIAAHLSAKTHREVFLED
ncbi:MAG: hypothetical protein ACFFAU_03335 [Candidatus Hodarchaeota archaeon]